MGKLTTCRIAVLLFFGLLLISEVGVSASDTPIEQVELSTCNCAKEHYDQCIVDNNTNTPIELGHDSKANVTLRLPNAALGEVLIDRNKLYVLSHVQHDEEVVVQGKHVKDSNYEDRLYVNWNIESSGYEWGLLTLDLSLHGFKSTDSRHLHVEIRTNKIVYKTPGSFWFPKRRRDEGDGLQIPAGMELETTTEDDMEPEIIMNGTLCQCHCQLYANASYATLLFSLCAFLTGVFIAGWMLYKWAKPNSAIFPPKLTWVGSELHVWIRWGSIPTAQAPLNEMEQYCIEQPQDFFIPPGRTARSFLTKQGQLQYTVIPS